MIEFIRGKIDKKLADKIIVEVNGIGYEVNVLSNTPKEGSEIKLYISESMNMFSGSNTWYGFLTAEERDLFEVIKGIQKIGAKGSIDILSKISGRTEEFNTCINNKDSEMLKVLFGFTKNKADKLILGLKDKIEVTTETAVSNTLKFKESDAVEALKSLGYAPAVAQQTITKIVKNCKNIENFVIEDVIREALKKIQ